MESSIEIRPSRRWAGLAIGAAGIWWVPIFALVIFGWPSADWIGKIFIAWLFLLSVTITFGVATGWKRLSLTADSSAVRFGRRVLSRSDLATIAIGPVARTPARFWLNVLMMAVTTDVSRRVCFLSKDGRTLLETTDLYGSSQLGYLAAFLGVPLRDNTRPN